jgi:hypothetical protein
MNTEQIYTDLYYLNADMEVDNYIDHWVYKNNVLEYVGNLYSKYNYRDVEDILEHFIFIRNYYYKLTSEKN